MHGLFCKREVADHSVILPVTFIFIVYWRISQMVVFALRLLSKYMQRCILLLSFSAYYSITKQLCQIGHYFFYHLANAFIQSMFFACSMIVGRPSSWTFPYWHLVADMTRSVSLSLGESIVCACSLQGNSLVIVSSLALSVKMSILLYIPAVGLLLLKRRGLVQTALYLSVVIVIQMMLAFDFLTSYPWEYISGAFDLSRAFLYKWTVNWKMVEESTFLRPEFARVLIVGHLTVLAIFGFFKWPKADGGALYLIREAMKNPTKPASNRFQSPPGACMEKLLA
jgi:hypothetical protein